ncbi:hypothetical protein [Pacificimonas flava]|uniref:hypothetical protein n=1 Tax=Pacificimonas flava TaxID=1234595 RepID=UPI0005716102|nr:hypothetical protein [Pacificimonas flava]MBB5281532.1 hypothetical protein [Pacificimonas flava]
MGKFLIALAWLFFIQDPITTTANQVGASGLPFFSEIQAGAFNLDRVPTDLMQEGGVGSRPEPVLDKPGSPPVNFHSDVAGRPSSHIANGDGGPAGILDARRETETRHETIGHHSHSTSSGQASRASEYDPNGPEKYAEGSQESYEGIQSIGLGSDHVAEADRRRVGPLRTEIGFLDSIPYFVAIAAMLIGTFEAIFAFALQQPIFTRRWYYDAVLGQVIAVAGLICLVNIFYAEDPWRPDHPAEVVLGQAKAHAS